LLWIAAAGLALGVIVYLGALGLMRAGLLPGGASIALGGVRGDLRETWPYVIPALLAAVVAIAVGLVIVFPLRRLFRHFAADAPFSADNANHPRAIWITLLVMEVSRYASTLLMHGMLLALGQPHGVEMSLNYRINLSAWFGILVLIVLAEVF